MVLSGEKWGIFMLTGEYTHSIDEKGRIIIPSKIRSVIGNNIIITRGMDGCLFGYSKESWENLVSKLETLPFTKKDNRNFIRFFTSGAIALKFDKQGRINIPNYLSEYANLLDDVIIIGVINRIEIWNKEKWNNFLRDNVESLSDISENLFASNLDL